MRRRGHGTAIALVTVLLFAFAPTSIAGAADSPGGASSGSVSGFVLGGNVGALPGARVSVSNLQNSVFVSGAVAAADGSYSIADVPPGEYYVRANASDYPVTFWPDAREQDAATRVTVTAGAATTGVDFTLMHGATVTGRVTGPGGAPVAGVQVFSIIGSTGYGSPSTDAAGTYSLGGTPAPWQPHRVTAIMFTPPSGSGLSPTTVALSIVENQHMIIDVRLDAFGRFTTTTRPYVSGTKRVGRTVKVHVGGWSPKPTTYAVQWYRSGKKIAHAQWWTYRLTAADRGTRITVTVSARRMNYVARSATSVPTVKIAKRK